VNANNRVCYNQPPCRPASPRTLEKRGVVRGAGIVVVGGGGIVVVVVVVVVAVVKKMRAEVFNVIFKADVFFTF